MTATDDHIYGIIADLVTAATNCSLYNVSHESVSFFLARAIENLPPLMKEGLLHLTLLDETLLLNDTRVPPKTLHVRNLIGRLRRKGIEKIVIREGITTQELSRFIACLTSAALRPVATTHLTFGVMEVKLASEGEDLRLMMDRSVEEVKEIHRGLARFGKLDQAGIEEVVLRFMTTLSRESNLLRLLCPVKSYSEFTYAHTANVAVIAIFLAESLGMQGDQLRDMGMAGLLHDIGKMFIPTAILDKKGKLDPGEWAVMKSHTERGAAYLSRLPNIPRFAVIAAYEHHLRFDGKGYPEPRRRGKNQHIVGRIIALADFIDALRAERPYQKAQATSVVMGLMEEMKGTAFDPALVDHTVRLFKGLGEDAPGA